MVLAKVSVRPTRRTGWAQNPTRDTVVDHCWKSAERSRATSCASTARGPGRGCPAADLPEGARCFGGGRQSSMVLIAWPPFPRRVCRAGDTSVTRPHGTPSSWVTTGMADRRTGHTRAGLLPEDQNRCCPTVLTPRISAITKAESGFVCPSTVSADSAPSINCNPIRRSLTNSLTTRDAATLPTSTTATSDAGSFDAPRGSRGGRQWKRPVMPRWSQSLPRALPARRHVPCSVVDHGPIHDV